MCGKSNMGKKLQQTTIGQAAPLCRVKRGTSQPDQTHGHGECGQVREGVWSIPFTRFKIHVHAARLSLWKRMPTNNASSSFLPVSVARGGLADHGIQTGLDWTVLDWIIHEKSSASKT